MRANETETAEAVIDIASQTAAYDCCGGPALRAGSACCVDDEAAKALGAAGCGCSSVQSPAASPKQCCGSSYMSGTVSL
jgi:hypothetical protein